MSNKEDNFKEQFKQALISTAKVISGDYKLDIKKIDNDLKSKKIDFFDVTNLSNKNDFIKLREEADSGALKKKFSDKEMEIILGKNKNLNNPKGKEKVSNMIKVASLTRRGFVAGDISTVMSPRTVLHWAENTEIFKDTGYAFRVTFLNKCDDIEKNTIAEYYQRCFGEELPESMVNIQI